MREIFVPHTYYNVLGKILQLYCQLSVLFCTELNCGETNLDSAFVLLDTTALLLQPMLTVYDVKYGVH